LSITLVRCGLPCTLTWCGEASVLVQVTGWPTATVTFSGPNRKSAMPTTRAPARGASRSALRHDFVTGIAPKIAGGRE
jgi:hypothetical protein